MKKKVSGLSFVSDKSQMADDYWVDQSDQNVQEKWNKLNRSPITFKSWLKISWNIWWGQFNSDSSFTTIDLQICLQEKG